MTTGQKAAAESGDSREFLPVMKTVYVSDVEKLLGKKYTSQEDLEASMAKDLRKYVCEVHQPKMDKLRNSEMIIKLLTVTCDLAGKALAEVPAKIASMQSIIDEQRIRIAYLQKQADRLDGLRKLCGYIEDGSHVTVSIGQDDATGEWYVGLDRKHLAHGENFNSAIDEAIRKDGEQDD